MRAPGSCQRPSSFGSNGKRLGGGNGVTGGRIVVRRVVKKEFGSPSNGISRSKSLFSPGSKIKVQRAPIMFGLSMMQPKPFQRPMTKRRAYDKNAESLLKVSCLGQRRRMDGMNKLMARAGRGLSYKLPENNKGGDSDESGSEDEEEEKKEEDRPFEPLCVWQSPHIHDDVEPRGLPPKMLTVMEPDEFGIEQPVQKLVYPPSSHYSKNDQYVPPVLAKWLRPHQREGVQFTYECVMGLREFSGNGCILADDMGLGKTLMSVALIWTLLNTGITAKGGPTARRVVVVCPCSLVKNWDNEFVKWLGPGTVKAMALAEQDRKTVEKNIDCFVKTKLFNVLIMSYECCRTHVGRLNKSPDACDLLVCDEAHRLKNRENQTSMALNSLQVKRRVLLTGTPMQNDLDEFFAMVDFTNPNILGTQEDFRKKIMYPILRGREPDAGKRQKARMVECQNHMSNVVNDFILRRINTLNAEHLPPKLVQVVCINLTDIQRNMYEHLVNCKDAQHVLDGKQVNCLSSIQMLMKLSNHPRLIAEDDRSESKASSGRNKKKVCYAEEAPSSAAPGADGVSKFLPYEADSGRRGMGPVRPEWSGKMFVLWRLMKEMRRPGNGGDKIVIISNYTQTLDLIGRMCRENSWGFCRLDGSIGMKKRQGMVDDFNDPGSSLVAFLLSSKAGGCGLNLIGGNRLVLFDPDWNPAVDKQAAARCWRDGQKKRCFTYRFLATGTVEEKIFQRQLSKEGLQSVVDDKEQVNALSTRDLKNLFKLRAGTPSDTHDKLKCERCKIVADDAEQESKKLLPRKMVLCTELLEKLKTQEDALPFTKPLDPQEYGITRDEYDKIIRQPMDLAGIQQRLVSGSNGAYKSVSEFSKDVNRIFSNVLKVWNPGQEIADAARRLQSWWIDEWTVLVPRLMSMKLDASEMVATDIGECVPTNDSNMVQRGEDFQEQLGMPDEENMRSWSHHYSTNTVDDPIFRAAMKGYDTVSFVFGLEVTWSLIQQRAMEEEEKAAMEELDRIQELDSVEEGNADEATENMTVNSNIESPTQAKKDNASVCSLDEEPTPSLSVGELIEEPVQLDENENNYTEKAEPKNSGESSDSDEEQWDLTKVYSNIDIQSENAIKCQNDDCERRACSIWTSSSGESWNACLVCQEEDFGEWPEDQKPDKARMDSIENLCGNSSKVCSPNTNDIPISSPPPQDAAKTSSNEWVCNQCTFSNKSTARQCSMCQCKRKRLSHEI